MDGDNEITLRAQDRVKRKFFVNHMISRPRRFVIQGILAIGLLISSTITIAGSYILLPAHAFQHDRGKPVTETISFSALDSSGVYTINVYDSGLEDHEPTGRLVSSGIIKLNGKQIFSSKDFKKPKKGRFKEGGFKVCKFKRGMHWKDKYWKAKEWKDWKRKNLEGKYIKCKYNKTTRIISKTVSLQEINELSVKLMGRPGGVIIVEIIGEDSVKPTISATVEPTANGADWHQEDVTVSFECDDATSGIASCTDPIVVTTEGTGQTITGTAVDNAGNQKTASVTLNVDLTAPEIQITAPANGAQLSDLTPEIQLTLTDNLALDGSSLALTVNGQPIDGSCNIQNSTATCLLNSDLPRVDIQLIATVSDLAENSGTDQITFSTQTDSDGDGVDDTADQCPNTPSGETVDSNGCSISQLDSDNDGVPNTTDQCPNTLPNIPVEADGCDDSQRDSDSDGVIDIEDAFPNDPTETSDFDQDGTGDNADLDDDNDNVADDEDAFPFDPTETSDLDGDGIGDNADLDRDGDDVANDSDAYPDDPARSTLPIVTIDSPNTLTTVGHTPIGITGTADPSAVSLTLNGVPVTINNGAYSAQVALEEGSNTIIARMVDNEGAVSTASIHISLDRTPPYITVESHQENQTVYNQPIAISGLINDIVRGTVEQSQANLVVEANGSVINAVISNRSYLAEGLLLIEGLNTITINGSDQVGNTAQKILHLTYQPPLGQKLQLISGQGQSAFISTILPNPLELQVLDANDTPKVGETVVFRVIEGAGLVAPGSADEGRAVVVTTDPQGKASTRFRLGLRSGAGNHAVRAQVVGFDNEIIFYATAENVLGNKLSINSGNNQRGAIHRPLPAPFIVAVNDAGANLVQGARVEFKVISGGGRFENSQPTIISITDSDGRATAHLTLGGVEGLDTQRITATLLDVAASVPAGEIISSGFTASALVTGDPGVTTITGIVLDNQDNPLPGVTIRVDGTTRQAVADAQGQFTITQAPVGPVHLIVDGSTTTVAGEYPNLSYNIVTVSGVENPLSAPIYMVKLNQQNAKYAGLEDVEVTLDEVPGFKLTVPAGSVTFPDGSREGWISVTVVNAAKVPMAPPNGMQPQLIVTIQPTGAMFDPPAPLTLPNVDGHLPGAQVEMYSYDHDLEEFVTIGLGTVNRDGTLIESNTGVGVIKAGWHCGSQPEGDGCTHYCADYCQECNADCVCVVVPEKEAETQTPENCQKELCSGPEEDNDDKPDPSIDIEYDCKKPGCKNGVPGPAQEDDDGDISEEDELCKECESGLLENKPDLTAPVSSDLCLVCQGGALISKLDLDIFKPTPTIGGKLDASAAAQPLINKINGGLSKLGLPINVSNVSVSGSAEYKPCCVADTGQVLEDQTFEEKGSVSFTVKATRVRMPGVGYRFSDDIMFLGGRIEFDAQVGIEVSANLIGSVTVGYREEGCDGGSCTFGDVGLNFSPTMAPTAQLIACIDIFSNTNCLGGDINAPLSTNFSANFGINLPACGVPLQGSGNIGKITASGEVVIYWGQETITYSLGTFELYGGGTF